MARARAIEPSAEVAPNIHLKAAGLQLQLALAGLRILGRVGPLGLPWDAATITTDPANHTVTVTLGGDAASLLAETIRQVTGHPRERTAS